MMVVPAPPQSGKASTMTEMTFRNRLRELSEHRAACIRDLRALADLLENTAEPGFPTPEVYAAVYSVSEPRADDPYSWAPTTLADVHMAMAAAPGDWRKTAYADEIRYAKKIGSAISVSFPVDRATTCKRVKTGTRHVEAVPAHDVDVFEWQCPDTDGS